jgi:hypothetical protein
MSKTLLSALTAAVLVAVTGCASTNRIVGHKLKEVGHWYGELGITGHLNEVTVRSQSRLTTLSIIGDGNTVVVEDRSTLAKIEIWGGNNTISIPDNLVVRVSQVGKGNQIIRRKPEPSAPLREPVTEAAPKMHMPPETVEEEPPAQPEAEPAAGEESDEPAESEAATE